jgi:hypothetical protein
MFFDQSSVSTNPEKNSRGFYPENFSLDFGVQSAGMARYRPLKKKLWNFESGGLGNPEKSSVFRAHRPSTNTSPSFKFMHPKVKCLNLENKKYMKYNVRCIVAIDRKPSDQVYIRKKFRKPF